MRSFVKLTHVEPMPAISPSGNLLVDAGPATEAGEVAIDAAKIDAIAGSKREGIGAVIRLSGGHKIHVREGVAEVIDAIHKAADINALEV